MIFLPQKRSMGSLNRVYTKLTKGKYSGNAGSLFLLEIICADEDEQNDVNLTMTATMMDMIKIMTIMKMIKL